MRLAPLFFALLALASCSSSGEDSLGQVGSGGGAPGGGAAGGGAGGPAGAAGQGQAGGGQAGGGQAGGGQAAGGLVGSYQLRFTSVKGNGPLPSGTTFPSLQRAARVDIRETADGLDAAFTGDWSTTPRAMKVKVTATEVQLSGEGWIALPFDHLTLEDQWTQLSLGRAPSGALSGSVEGKGATTIETAQDLDQVLISGEGEIGPDPIAPEARPFLASLEAGEGTVLPWDPVRVWVNEGVSPETLYALTTLAVGDLPAGALPTNALFYPDQKAEGSWAGVVGVEARLGPWDSVVGKPVRIDVAGGLVDPSGNTSASATGVGQVPDVGPPVKAHTLDPQGPLPWLFGASGLLEPGSPHCEAGGCLRLGPFSLEHPPLGVAGRLALTKSAPVSVRYRVASSCGSAGPPTLQGYALALKLYDTIGGIDLVVPDVPVGPFTHHPDAPDDLVWSTAWNTVTGEAWGLASYDDVGFVLHAGSCSVVCSDGSISWATLFVDGIGKL